jgi:hypothetical protein
MAVRDGGLAEFVLHLERSRWVASHALERAVFTDYAAFHRHITRLPRVGAIVMDELPARDGADGCCTYRAELLFARAAQDPESPSRRSLLRFAYLCYGSRHQDDESTVLDTGFHAVVGSPRITVLAPESTRPAIGFYCDECSRLMYALPVICDSH